MTLSEMQALWENTALANIKTNLNQAFQSSRKPQSLLQIKQSCIFMCKALEPCDLHITPLYDHLMDKREPFNEILGEILADSVRTIVETKERYIGWQVTDENTYNGSIKYYLLEDEDNEQDPSTLKYPYEVPFSDTIPSICNEITKFFEHVKTYTHSLTEEIHVGELRATLDKHFCKSVVDVIDDINFDRNKQRLKIHQLAQLAVNAHYFGLSRRYFEQLLLACTNASEFSKKALQLKKTKHSIESFETTCTDSLFTLLDERIVELMSTLDTFDFAPQNTQ
eukprot:UN31891